VTLKVLLGKDVRPCIPFRSFYDKFHRILHVGKGRKIVPGQKIHASVAFKERLYNPRAQAISSMPKIEWQSLVGTGKINDISWAQKWEEQLEMDIFDRSLVQEIVEELKQNGIKSKDLERSVDRLRFTALISKYWVPPGSTRTLTCRKRRWCQSNRRTRPSGDRQASQNWQ
jgi:hypothetical protein